MKSRIALALPLAALPLVLLSLLLARNPAVAEVDAVSAASMIVGSTNITDTSATITFTNDKYNYGTRTLCYNPAPATAANNCVTKNASGNSGSFDIKKLKPLTQYNYSIKAVDTRGGERPYTYGGTFKTLASKTTGLIPVLPRSVGADAVRFDANGRRLDAGNARRVEHAIFTKRTSQRGVR